MPARSKKQLNYFKLVKAYKDNGYKGLFGTWKDIFGKRPFPKSDYINKIISTSQKINYADLTDLASGIEGESPVGDKRDIKVGYWALFTGRYRDSKGIPKENKFIAQIKKVDFNNNIANFNRFEFYNRFGARTETPYRIVVTNPEFQFMDYAYFKDIIKTGKSVKDVSESREGSVLKEIPAGFGDESFSDYTGTLSESWSDIFKQTIRLMIGS
jgi:hypothetical protein